MGDSKIFTTPDDVYKQIVAESACASDVIRQLGMSTTGSRNFRLVGRRNELLGITFGKPYDHRGGIGRVKTDDEVFCRNSQYSDTRRLAKRAIEKGYLEERCYICGLGPVWNDKPLHLVLDHIDGVHDNNEPDNLRLLCPNCDSQTATYRGRNKGTYNKIQVIKPQFFCEKCGAEIVTKDARFCAVCAMEERRKVDRPSKEELAELIRDKSFVQIGKMYGVSDNAVRKWCKSYDLPTKKREMGTYDNKCDCRCLFKRGVP